MECTSYGMSDVGRVRDHNEDRWFVGATVVAVADGLGGHAAGEVASTLAIEPVAALDGKGFTDPEEAVAAVRDAIGEANLRVIRDADEHPEHSGMGTTLTVAVTVDDQLVMGHVGDSRAYLFRNGSLEQLTTDHTVVEEAMAEGVLTPAQAAAHPARHTLTRAVGLDAEVEVETPTPRRLATGDRLLLCSDGLTEVVADQDLTRLLTEHDHPQAACDALVGAALAGGGPDNVTVVVVSVADGEAPGA